MGKLTKNFIKNFEKWLQKINKHQSTTSEIILKEFGTDEKKPNRNE